jgi:hypothetical protein
MFRSARSWLRSGRALACLILLVPFVTGPAIAAGSLMRDGERCEGTADLAAEDLLASEAPWQSLGGDWAVAIRTARRAIGSPGERGLKFIRALTARLARSLVLRIAVDSMAAELCSAADFSGGEASPLADSICAPTRFGEPIALRPLVPTDCLGQFGH